MNITGAQCRSARALVKWTRENLASNSDVDASVIEEFERRIPLADEDICDRLRTALESAGAVFIAGNGGGAGVRLNLNRSKSGELSFSKMKAGSSGQTPSHRLRFSSIDEFTFAAPRWTIQTPALADQVHARRTS